MKGNLRIHRWIRTALSFYLIFKKALTLFRTL
jgi:hypothetical protein